MTLRMTKVASSLFIAHVTMENRCRYSYKVWPLEGSANHDFKSNSIQKYFIHPRRKFHVFQLCRVRKSIRATYNNNKKNYNSEKKSDLFFSEFHFSFLQRPLLRSWFKFLQQFTVEVIIVCRKGARLARWREDRHCWMKPV